MVHRKRHTMTALAAIAFVAAACSSAPGGGDPPPGDVNVVATDFKFSPGVWSGTAGEDISVVFDNQGSLPHQWTLINSGTTIASEAEISPNNIAFDTEAIPGGAAATTVINLPPGKYQVVCAVPGHFSAGMEATLELTE
ncbi:MAG: sulfocyanin-like copper-binding protein [Acidimicrobiia bacterium]